MKRIILSLVALMAIAINAGAQPQPGTFSIIPRIGVTLAKLTGDDLHVADGFSLSPKYKPGLTAGAEIEYQATNILAVSLGAYYSRQGEKYDDYKEAHDPSTKKWSEMRDLKSNYDYVNIPLMLSIYGARNLAFKVGAQLGFNTKATSEMTTATFARGEDGKAATESVEKSKTTTKLKKVDFSIPIGLSYEYMNVILEARYNLGLTKVYKHGTDGKNSVFTFSAGYRFKL